VAEAQAKVAAAPDVAGERLDRRGRRAAEPARERREVGRVARDQ
jgi:hypothetical protein